MKTRAILFRSVVLIALILLLISCQQLGNEDSPDAAATLSAPAVESTETPPDTETTDKSSIGPEDTPEPTPTDTQSAAATAVPENQEAQSDFIPEIDDQASAQEYGPYTVDEMIEIIMEKETQIEPMQMEKPAIERVTVEIERLPMPPKALSSHKTAQFVEGLAIDNAGQLWSKMPEGYVRWDLETGAYEWDEAPDEIITGLRLSSTFACNEIAEELGQDAAELPYFSSCQPGFDGESYWFSSFEDGIYHYDGRDLTHYTTENGLPSNEVSDLLVDSNGTIWAATFAGVAAFDGESWTTYDKEDGLSELFATELAVDRDGNLWVGTRNFGVAHYDGEKWRPDNVLISGAVTDIFVDSQGGLWIPDLFANRLHQLVEGTWLTHDLDPPSGDLYGTYFFEVDIAPDGAIWIATSGGVIKLDQSDVSWISTEDGLADNFVNDLLVVPDGSILFATGSGISHFDGTEWQTYALSEGPGISYPMSTYADSGGNVWFGAVDGVARLTGDGTWDHYPQFAAQSDYLPGLVSITESGDDQLFGAGCAGVFKFGDDGWEMIMGGPQSAYGKELFEQVIYPWCSTEIAVVRDGQIWINQMDIPQDNEHGVLQVQGDDYDWYATPYVTTILPRENGDVWFGTKEGVLTFNEGMWGKIPDEVYGEYAWITAGMIGPQGDAWFGTPVGFARFDGERWTNYELADGADLDVFALTYDDNDAIWLSTLDGIGRFDGQKLVLYEYDRENPFAEISNPELLGVSMVGVSDSIATGPDGALWMSFGPEGIIRFDQDAATEIENDGNPVDYSD